MIIELKEYELPKDKHLHDADAYKETGLFLVNDGVCLFIVAVPVVGEPPLFIPVPFGELSKYIHHQSAYETASNITVKITKQLEDISSKVDGFAPISIIGKLQEVGKEFMEMSKREPIHSERLLPSFDYVPQIYHEEKIDGSTLLKAIALIQNPELGKELFNQEQ